VDRRVVILIVVFCLTTLGNGFGRSAAVTSICGRDDVVHRLGERTPRSAAELRQETEHALLLNPTAVTPATWPCESRR